MECSKYRIHESHIVGTSYPLTHHLTQGQDLKKHAETFELHFSNTSLLCQMTERKNQHPHRMLYGPAAHGATHGVTY